MLPSQTAVSMCRVQCQPHHRQGCIWSAAVGQELIFGVPGLPIALGCNESFPGGSRSGYADHF